MPTYDKEDVLGTGKIWLVKSSLSRQPYVLKEISMNSVDENYRHSALSEVLILSKCKHENVIKYKDAFLDKNGTILSIIMEYAEGGDLGTAINNRQGVPFSEKRILTWFVQISLALQYLHYKNILHRDLKPENIHLTRNREIKIGDFGISRILRDPNNLQRLLLALLIISRDLPKETSDNICLFNKKKERNEFQLTKSWNNVKSILTGDFLLTGYSQLLLIKTQKFNCWQENCILSDITNFIPVDLIYQSKKSDESMNKTIPGIMANIETGKAAIEKTQSDIIQKSEAIHHALYQCNCGKDDVNINHHVSSFTETLVDILLNDHENSKQENISNNVQLELLNHWIRVCNNCWILCWTLTNTSEKTICNPFINIISKDQQLQSIQKVFVHKNTEFAIDDQIQKHVERKKTFSIILHLENPKFLIESTKVLVNLTWYSGNSDEFENELFSPFEEKVLFQKKLSLNTTLAFSTMFVRKDSPDTYKNLACMKVQQQEMILNVTSLHSSFAQFEAYFTTSTFDEALLLSPHHSELKILIFRNINSPLHGVSMNFKNEEENEVEVVAYVRNDHQMYSLVQYMYHSLPQDVLILPKSITHTESVEMKRQAVINMKTEVDMLASAMKIHNIQDFATANPQLPTQAGSVNIPKETYLRIRRSLMKSECLTDNIMQSLSKNEEKVKL